MSNRLKMGNTDDQFSLKWNNFQSNLATGFHDLLQDEDMVDVTLAVEGKILHAHKVILSVCSPYFKDLFKVNPCKHPIVILKDVGYQELSDMLDFMYRGEASVRQEDLAAFLKLAETLKIKGLAGDKEESSSAPPVQSHKKSYPLVPRKKKADTLVYEHLEGSGDSDFNAGEEVRKKRKRLSSPLPKTDNTSISATNCSYVPLASPKKEIQEQDVEYTDNSTNNPLVHFISGKQKKEDEDGNDYDLSQENIGDETHDDEMNLSMGPSNLDESAEQMPQDFRRGPLDHRKSTIDTLERLNGKPHYHVKNKNGKKKDCLVCSNRRIKGGRHETRYYCETCTRKPGLHPGICFKRYHTMQKFKM